MVRIKVPSIHRMDKAFACFPIYVREAFHSQYSCTYTHVHTQTHAQPFTDPFFLSETLRHHDTRKGSALHLAKLVGHIVKIANKKVSRTTLCAVMFVK